MGLFRCQVLLRRTYTLATYRLVPGAAVAAPFAVPGDFT